MVEEFLEKLPEIDTRYEDIVPMERMNSTVSNGGGSVTVTMQRDDDYRSRMMKIERVERIERVELPAETGLLKPPSKQQGQHHIKIASDRTDSLWQTTTDGGGHHDQRHQQSRNVSRHQHQHEHHQQQSRSHPHQHHHQKQLGHTAQALKNVADAGIVGGGSSSSHRESMSRRPDTTTVSDSTTYSREGKLNFLLV